MRLSKNFVNEYTNLNKIDFKELADGMLKLGNEYESITKLVNATKVTTGEVIECKNHPESDHLHLCKVDIGSEVLNIVCGAPNVREGLKVIVALVGCELGDFKIKSSTILGHESNGMLCSLQELGLDNKYLTEADIAGIHELPEEAIVGEDPIRFLELDDEIIDFELTSNRGDLLSMLGLAYECATITGEDVKLPNLTYTEIKESIKNELILKVETENAYTFLLKGVKNIKIEESPAFIKNRLIACGIRPINNVVDISNYVMLETGQPLHFYDADKLGNTIGVRNAKNGEKLVTLDEQERILVEDDIVITNGKDAIGLAGVMGGYSTEIDENTKNVVIECAIFNPLNIRKTSKKLLRSEASIRFEKGLDVNRCYMAIERACNMLEKYAYGNVMAGMIEHNTLSKEDTKVDLTLEKINSILGFELGKNDVIDCFKKLHFEVTEKEGIFTVTIPTRRIDVHIEEDLIEEVGRVYGVDNMNSTLPMFETNEPVFDKRTRIIKDKMVSLGLSEVYTYSLIDVKDVFKFTNDEFGLIKVLDPMNEQRVVLRHSIINSLLEVFDYNKKRSTKDLGIFEVANCFSLINGEYIEESKLACLCTGEYTEGLNKEKYDFYVMKGIVEDLLDHLGYANRYSFVTGELPCEMHPTKSCYINVSGKIVGLFGQVHPKNCKDEVYVLEINLDTLFDIKTGKIKVKEITKFPGMSKDVAFVLDKNITSDEVITNIKKEGGKLLKSVTVFDYYEGEKIEDNKKSIAYNLYFENSERTLTDEEVTPIFDKIIENVCKKYNATIRNK